MSRSLQLFYRPSLVPPQKRWREKTPLTAKQLNDSAAADHAILPIPPMFSASRACLVPLYGKDKALRK
jgi:hypothetical protein